jgi:hypothetical protein
LCGADNPDIEFAAPERAFCALHDWIEKRPGTYDIGFSRGQERGRLLAMPKTLRHALALIAGASLSFVAAPALADGLSDEPLARFEDPVCPGVVGLQVDYATALVARIRANAAELGIQTADEDNCEPNLIVAFLSDGRDYLQRLNGERGWLFESLDRSERQALLNSEGPARAWITTITRTRDGLPVRRRENLVNIPHAGMWSAHSLIYVPTRQDITSAMVLIDRDAIEGYSANQLADYASLFGFADFVPQADADTPSIQRLFDTQGTSPPESLTLFDRAYLERLYSSIPNLPAYARLKGLEGMAPGQ